MISCLPDWSDVDISNMLVVVLPGEFASRLPSSVHVTLPFARNKINGNIKIKYKVFENRSITDKKDYSNYTSDINYVQNEFRYITPNP